MSGWESGKYMNMNEHLCRVRPLSDTIVAVEFTGAISVAEIGAFSLVNQPGLCPLIGF